MNDKVKNFFHRVNCIITEYADEACYPYFTFGVFAIITYPLFFIFWKFYVPMEYENLILRLIVVLLAIPLTIEKIWPKKVSCLLPLYWYFTLTYSLPFLFTYFLLRDNFSLAADMNIFTVIILLMLLLDMALLFLLLSIGVLTGALYYFIQPHHLIIQTDLFTVFSTYFAALVFGCIFSHKKDLRRKQEKLNEVKQGMNDILAIIAHEIRTPLIAINNDAIGIEKVFPSLVEDHDIAKEHGLNVSQIPKMKLTRLLKATQDIQKEVYYTNSTVDLLLTNISNVLKNQQAPQTEHEFISMRETIDSALTRYPFTSTIARSKISFEDGQDFHIHAQKTLVENVFTNLLKNALYYTNNGQNGDIEIRIDTSKDKNVVIFEDTGTGIKDEYLKKIFGQFFTLREEGVGIGLFYCKKIIESCGGEIFCESEYGKYTRFIIEFRLNRVA